MCTQCTSYAVVYSLALLKMGTMVPETCCIVFYCIVFIEHSVDPYKVVTYGI